MYGSCGMYVWFIQHVCIVHVACMYGSRGSKGTRVPLFSHSSPTLKAPLSHLHGRMIAVNSPFNSSLSLLNTNYLDFEVGLQSKRPLRHHRHQITRLGEEAVFFAKKDLGDQL